MKRKTDWEVLKEWIAPLEESITHNQYGRVGECPLCLKVGLTENNRDSLGSGKKCKNCICTIYAKACCSETPYFKEAAKRSKNTGWCLILYQNICKDTKGGFNYPDRFRNLLKEILQWVKEKRPATVGDFEDIVLLELKKFKEDMYRYIAIKIQEELSKLQITQRK